MDVRVACRNGSNSGGEVTKILSRTDGLIQIHLGGSIVIDAELQGKALAALPPFLRSYIHDDACIER